MGWRWRAIVTLGYDADADESASGRCEPTYSPMTTTGVDELVVVTFPNCP